MAARPRIGWIAYASLLTFAVVAGEVSNVTRGGEISALTLASWLLSVVLLVALWGHALQRRVGSERYWRTVFWLVAFANGVMLVPVLFAGGLVAQVTFGMTLLIVPAYVAAWRYAYRSPALWSTPS